MDRKPFLVALAELVSAYWPRLNLGQRCWLRAWLPTPGNVLFTLLIVVGLLWATNVGALPLRAPAAVGTSTTTLSYQGRLADNNGNPVTSSGLGMTFRLYNTDNGDSPLWTESHTAVPVNNGLFHVLLGSVEPIPVPLFTNNSTLWLGIQVGADREMSPREQMASVPYAVQALTVPDGSITTAKLADGAVTQHQFVSGATGDSTSSTSFVDMAGRSVMLTTTGGPVLAMFSGSHHPNAAGMTGYWRIIRDDSVVVAYNNHSFESSQYEWTTTTLFGVDTPPAGSHTYKVQWRVSSGTLFASAGVYSENFAVIEFKR